MSAVIMRPTDGRWTGLPHGLCGELRRREARAAERAGLEGTAAEADHDTARRSFVLRLVQPALAGLMDGSVSTLAPLYATAFATHDVWKTLMVGLASSIGAGISMGFAEGLSDDGALSGRGDPKVRGLVCGVATAIGGLGHTLPFLLADFRMALLASLLVVFVELWAIAYVRARYMDTSMLRAIVQIVIGGAVVLGVGVALGAS